MVQHLIVAGIVAACALILVWRVVRTVTSRSSGCAACPARDRHHPGGGAKP